MPVSVSTAGISLTLSPYGHSSLSHLWWAEGEVAWLLPPPLPVFSNPSVTAWHLPYILHGKTPRKATGHGREEVLNTTPMMSFQSLTVLRKEYEMSSNATIQQREKIKMVIPIFDTRINFTPLPCFFNLTGSTSHLSYHIYDEQRERSPNSVTSTVGIF